MPAYRPFKYRTPDNQYAALLFRLLRQGILAPSTRQGVAARTLIQETMKFDLRNGFPMITDRSMESFWTRPIGELCAFINGATTLEELVTFGCTWWDPWVTEEKTAMFGLQSGEIGPASYGGAFHDFPTRDGGSFDQYENLLAQILQLPYDRVHFVTPWIPDENSRAVPGRQKTTIAPCHGWVHVRVLEDGLHLHMFQRSGDVPVGVPSNMIQYAALALMIEHLTDTQASFFHHTISDAHVYVDQVPNVLEMLGRQARRLPKVHLNEAGEKITDIHDFRREHFVVSQYKPHPAIAGIPVAT